MSRFAIKITSGISFGVLLGLAALPAIGQSDKKLEREEFDALKEPPAAVHWARGQGGPPFGGGSSSSPNMTYHGGEIMTSAVVQSIFWGTSWVEHDSIMNGLDSFYEGLSGSAYAGTNTEYEDGTGHSVGSSVSYIYKNADTKTHLIDNRAAPSRAPKTSAILAEVCSQVPSPISNGYYPVYTDTKRGSAGYCAWHSWGSCQGVPIQFAFFFKLDGDAGCSVDSSRDGLANLVNVSGHEYSEAVTDPRGSGWYDKSGYENADKCAWTFGGSLIPIGNTSWKIQGNWSNKAYSAGIGYIDSSKGKVIGCVDGTNATVPIP